MSFDPTIYAALAANPAQQAQYLMQFSTAPAAPAVPAATPAPVAQGYSNPSAVQAPPQQLANGTLEDFYNQPTGSGGGPSVTSKFFTKRQQGSWLQLEVVSDATNSDVRQQTTPQGIPQTFKDGRPKFVLVVKVKVLGSSDGTHVTEFPDGLGSLWVKGVLADELRRAMAAAGDPSGYPKGGAQIVMISAGEQASRTPGFSATKLYQLQYAGAAGEQRDLQAVAQAANPVNPTAAPSPAPAVNATAPSAATTTPPATAPVPAPAPVASAPALALPSTPAPATVPSSPVPAPPAIGESKEALLARLSGVV